MELGAIGEINYTPKWNGNQELPESERLSLKILPPTAADVLQSGDAEDIYAWRDNLKGASEKALAVLRGATPSSLRRLRLLMNYTKDLRNFEFGGEAVTDPIEVWPRISVNAWGLALEVYNEIDKVTELTEDEAGNSPSPSDGDSTQTNGSAQGAAEGDDPESADTTKEGTE